MADNPYEAPKAQLAEASSSLGDWREAIDGFVKTGNLAAFAGIGSVFLAPLCLLLTRSPALPTQSRLVFTVFAGGSLIYGVLLMRLWLGIKRAARQPTEESVTALLNAVNVAWGGTVTLQAVWLVAIAGMRVLGVGAAAIAGGVDGLGSGIVGAVRRQRWMLVAVMTLGVLSSAMTLVKQAITGPTPQQLQASAMFGFDYMYVIIGSIAFQAGFLWLIWRQAAACAAFVAQPSIAALRLVGHHHWTLWRTLFWLTIAGFICAIVFAVFVAQRKMHG